MTFEFTDQATQEDRVVGHAWFESIVDSSFDAVIGKRLDGTIISWNHAAEEIYGYTATEAIGRHISLVVPPEKRDEVDRILQGLPRGQGVRGLETVRIRKDGRRIDVSLTISPVRGSDGNVLGGSVVARDVTEAKQMRESLREGRERLSIAVRAADIGLFRWESNSDHVEWDDTMRAIFGLPKDHSVRSLNDFLDLLHPSDREQVAEEVRRSIQAGTEYTREYRIVRPDGELRWIAAKARPFHEAGGGTYLTGACRDVTERRETQEALAAALAQKELLLQEINHRVKNSLQLASSLLHVQAKSSGSVEVDQALSEAGSRLITVARVHERLYRGADVKSVDLADFLAHLCTDIRRSTPVGTSEIFTEVEPTTLGADKAVIVGLLVNELVTNALKHGAPIGSGCDIRVTCRRNGTGLALSVADTGQGLPVGFDVKASGSYGMRLINAFAQQLGGDLEVRSSDAGTRFTIEFALKPCP